MVDENTSMREVLDALKRAEPTACYEFCRRQRTENPRPLADGARLLGRVAHRLQCERPDELMAWKFPECYEPIPGDALPKALEAAAQGDEPGVYEALRNLGFADVTAAASAAAHLAQSADYLLAYPHRRPKEVDPQGELFRHD